MPCSDNGWDRAMSVSNPCLPVDDSILRNIARVVPAKSDGLTSKAHLSVIVSTSRLAILRKASSSIVFADEKASESARREIVESKLKPGNPSPPTHDHLPVCAKRLAHRQKRKLSKLSTCRKLQTKKRSKSAASCIPVLVGSVQGPLLTE